MSWEKFAAMIQNITLFYKLLLIIFQLQLATGIENTPAQAG